MAEHIVQSYDRELETLGRKIAEMGGLAESMLLDAMDSLSGLNAEQAREVIAIDQKMDLLHREIEDGAIRTILRRQPMAIDLRECVGAIRIAGDLERIGDLAKNIAKRALKIVGSPSTVSRAIVGLKAMHETAALQLKEVLDAYALRDMEAARKVWLRDVELDALEDSVFRDLLTFMMEDARAISFCSHLLFCSKNIERIGDHSTNISETIIYVVSGETLTGEERPKGTLLSSPPPST